MLVTIDFSAALISQNQQLDCYVNLNHLTCKKLDVSLDITIESIGTFNF